MTSELCAVETGGSFYHGRPPGDADADNWISSAHQIGTRNWASFEFLFFGPDGVLFAVEKNGFFFKGPPQDSIATKIGNAGWASFKFLFFGPDGDLYGVRLNGSFLKGPPPTYSQDNWMDRATTIGTTGWADFKFLFFGPDTHLYEVKEDGSFFKYNPPILTDDNWRTRRDDNRSAHPTNIGTEGWAAFKFLFFGPGDCLYAALENGTS